MLALRFAALAVGLVLSLSAGAKAQEALREERGFLRIKIAGRDVRLEMLTVRPETASGRLPLALITHGKSPSGLSMSELRAASYAPLARDLARRGWLAAVLVRRGFGQSDGPLPGPAISCDKPDLGARLATDAEELDIALKALKERPDVDGERVIAIGESAGGAAIMALAQRKPPGLRAVINVSGGLMQGDCPGPAGDSLVAMVGSWTGKDVAPQLWLYAKNDDLFPPPLVDRMRTKALDGGLDLRFVELPEIKPNGHLIFRSVQARFIWQREMDASLRAWKLPTWPAERARTAYATLGLTSRADVFERYFSAPGEKALAYSKDKKLFRYRFGSADMAAAQRGALDDCAKAASDCIIAFKNDRDVGNE
ncbi:hypothetical protein BH10PSE8_BH10PSE8_12680 [soil metagenome]